MILFMILNNSVKALKAACTTKQNLVVQLYPSRHTVRESAVNNGKTQTMSHIVESCPLTKLNGGLSRLHSADEDAVSWLTNYGK